MRLEEADEMLGVVKAQPIADHRDGEGVVIQQQSGMGKETVGNDVLGCTPRLCLDQCAEIACGKAALVGKPCYRGKTIPLGLGVYIVVEQGDEHLPLPIKHIFYICI